MMSYVPVTSEAHGESRWSPRHGYLHAKTQVFCRIAAAELSKILQSFVIAFVKEGDNFILGCVLGLNDRNHYVNTNGEWLGAYIPSEIRAYPFRAVTTENGQIILAVDKYAIQSAKKDDPGFYNGPALSPEVAAVYEQIRHYQSNLAQTNLSVKALADANLIKQWTPNVSIGAGMDTVDVHGLWGIDQDAVSSLDANDLKKLHDYGALGIAYAQLFSRGHWGEIKKRVPMLSALNKSLAGRNSAAEDIKKMLSGDNDDLEFG